MRTIEVNDVFSVVLIKQLICGSDIQLKFKKKCERDRNNFTVRGRNGRYRSYNLTIIFPKILVKEMFLCHVKYNHIFFLLHDALSNIEIRKYANVQEHYVVKTIRDSCQLMGRTIQLSAQTTLTSAYPILMKFKANRENICTVSILYILIYIFYLENYKKIS